RVVAAPVEVPDLLVAHVGDQLEQLGVGAEEVLTHVGPVLGLEVLVLAVDALLHALQQQAGGVTCEQLVPAAAPDDLDDVPAGAAEDALQLLDDLAVAPDPALPPLAAAGDVESQVV